MFWRPRVVRLTEASVNAKEGALDLLMIRLGVLPRAGAYTPYVKFDYMD